MSQRRVIGEPSARAGLLEGRAGAASSAVLAGLSCLVVPGGLLSQGWRGDVTYYGRVGARIMDGLIPYHNFYLEYPPGSTPLFTLPSLLSQHHYALAFKLVLVVCAAVAAAAGTVVVRRSGADLRAQRIAAVVLGLAPLAMGPLFMNRYDVFPAAIVTLTLLALLAGRPRLASALLAYTVMAKIYAIALVPIVALHIVRQRGRKELERSSAVFVAVCLVMTVPFAAVGFGGLGYSFYIQVTRHLQVESLGAQLLVVLHHLGLYHAVVFIGKPGSFDLAGTIANVVGSASTAAQVVVVVLVTLWYARGPVDSQRLVLACTTAVTGFAVFGKVLSPQYLVWLILIVPLVGAGAGLVATILCVAAVVMTQLSFYDSDGVANLTSISWLVLSRNIVLVAVFAVLARSLRKDVAT